MQPIAAGGDVQHFRCFSGGAEQQMAETVPIEGGDVAAAGGCKIVPAALLIQKLTVFCRQKEGLPAVFIAAAFQNTVSQVKSVRIQFAAGILPQYPGQPGIQIQSADAGGGAVVEGLPVPGNNGIANQILRGGDTGDFPEVFIQQHGLPGCFVKIGQALGICPDGRGLVIEPDVQRFLR